MTPINTVEHLRQALDATEEEIYEGMRVADLLGTIIDRLKRVVTKVDNQLECAEARVDAVYALHDQLAQRIKALEEARPPRRPPTYSHWLDMPR